MNNKEIKSLVKLFNEMGKDDIINMVIEVIKRNENIDAFQFFGIILEQDHISDSPYTWTDYANGETK